MVLRVSEEYLIFKNFLMYIVSNHVRLFCVNPSESEEAVWLWSVTSSAANRLIGEVVQSRRRPLLGPSPG